MRLTNTRAGAIGIVALVVSACAVATGLRCAVDGSSKPVALGSDGGGDACLGCSDASSMESSEFGSDANGPVLAAPTCTNCANGWCTVPAGTFVMGAPPTALTRAAIAEDQVTVTLTNAFEISQHEVTVEEWTAAGLALRTQPKEPTGCSDSKCPVYATWYDALTYANMKSQQHSPPLPPCYQLAGCSADGGTGLICSGSIETGPLYNCRGYRIPTEAEWEYACRAGTTTAFYDGDFTLSVVPPGANIVNALYDEPMLDPIAWYSINSDGGAHTVGSKWPNSFCIYDMLGNMAEWTSGGYNGQSYGSSPQVDPGAALGAFSVRVERGGAYYGWPAVVDCFNRQGVVVRVPFAGTGVRLVRTL